MFVDELHISVKAGKGGDGVVRWFRDRSRPLGGPAGGNGGRGGSVYVRAVRDNNVLSRYTGSKDFFAEDGGDGEGKGNHGKNGEDLYIDVPRGSVVTNSSTGRRIELFTPHESVLLLAGGNWGLGNRHFKSSVNRSPEEFTKGKMGEEGEFHIEVELVVDVGIIGEPNAGKSTLLNTLTRAQSKVASYPFTTLSPHLGDLYGFILADIPGLIEGASGGKGLGHTFLRHVKRTNMLLHCVSLEHENILSVYEGIRTELELYDKTMLEKSEWVVLTKADLVSEGDVKKKRALFEKKGCTVFVVSEADPISIKTLGDHLVTSLRERDTFATIGATIGSL